MDVTVSVLKEITDIELVAISLGIPMKRIGSKIQIICPSHNDKHFGSCYLTSNGYRCYSCGAKGDVIELVMAANKCGFKEACQYLADLQGVTLNFKGEANAAYKQILDADSLELIGLAPLRGAIVYETISIISEAEYDESDTKTDRIRWIPYTDEQLKITSGSSGYYVAEKAVIKSPLLQLWQQDIVSYNALIHDKALEAKDRFCKLLAYMQTASTTSVSETVMKMLLDDISSYVGYSNLSEHIKKNIAKCETIAIEHSDGTSETNPSSNPTSKKNSIFKVKKGVSI